jgi:hypothetical protein
MSSEAIAAIAKWVVRTVTAIRLAPHRHRVPVVPQEESQLAA